MTVGLAKLLCVPTTKVVFDHTYSPANPADQRLTCFLVSHTQVITPVYDENQFGQGSIHPETTKYLCLPSTVTSPILDHFVCYTATPEFDPLGLHGPAAEQTPNQERGRACPGWTDVGAYELALQPDGQGGLEELDRTAHVVQDQQSERALAVLEGE